MLDPDAAEQAAKKLVVHRITCRDRNRATRALLKQVKPTLFEKTRGQAKLTQYANVQTADGQMSGPIRAAEQNPLRHEVCIEQSLVTTGPAE